MGSTPPHLSLHNITKHFPGVVANDAVTLAVEPGTIHALVGENGAGKSTLMHIVYGLQQPDAGTIMLDGRVVSIPDPQAAVALGIGMVHQHFQLVPSLTVAENVALGAEPHRGPWLRRQQMIARVRALSERFGLHVDPTARVADLSVGVQQRVEILRPLYRDARLLILDEPSAVLTPGEVTDLFAVLRRLVAAGRTAIFITHKLDEVLAVCDRATVLRAGRVGGTVDVADTTAAELARMMVGQSVTRVTRPPTVTPGPPALIVRDLHALDPRGLPALRGIDLTVHAGEIVGLAGVEGSGQPELVETLIGLRPAAHGTIMLGGDSITTRSNRARRQRGLALIPEDRQRQGVSRPLRLWENIGATQYHTAAYGRAGWLRVGALRGLARRRIDAYDIRPPDELAVVGALSGGNMQKLVIARELIEQPRVLIAAQPTRGLDIRAARSVHDELLRLRATGTGVLLLSADLDEVLALSDRILVLYEGRIAGELPAAAATRERLGLLMAGQSADSV